MYEYDYQQQKDKTSRRDFLKSLGILSTAALAADAKAAEQIKKKPYPKARKADIPRIKFGKHSLSRLICGANPFNGGSHLSVFVNYEMKRYYTQEQILKTLRRCQEVGINCWQSSRNNYELYRRFTDQGGKMHYISLGKTPPDIEEFAKAGAIGIAHHGELTDRLSLQSRPAR
jgi:hypothetical protein